MCSTLVPTQNTMASQIIIEKYLRVVSQQCPTNFYFRRKVYNAEKFVNNCYLDRGGSMLQEQMFSEGYSPLTSK